MAIYHLEEHMKHATTLSLVSGVYWSARDMDTFFIGNHHFITFVYDDLEQAKRVTQKWNIEYRSEMNDKGISVLFSTMGATTDNGDKSGKIVIGYNPSSDIKSLHEIAKDCNTSWNKPDADYEGHRIPYNHSSNDFVSNEALMHAILERVSNFNANHDVGETVNYSLVDENCACVVNSIFRVLGYSLKFRKELGEFGGVDWGEEDKIPDSYFAPPGGVKPVCERVGSTWLYILLS